MRVFTEAQMNGGANSKDITCFSIESGKAREPAPDIPLGKRAYGSLTWIIQCDVASPTDLENPSSGAQRTDEKADVK
jgi:hypothetical protein